MAAPIRPLINLDITKFYGRNIKHSRMKDIILYLTTFIVGSNEFVEVKDKKIYIRR